MSTVATPTAVEKPAARTPSALPASPRAHRFHTGASLLLTVVLLAAAWWFVAPPQLGGATTFVTVDGTSMLPSLRRSDLVALRLQHSYRVGEVVGYRSALIRRIVLHRIVAIRDGRYEFKGDNNSFVDPDRPTRAQLVGRLWLHLPSAGRLVSELHRPAIAGGLAAVLVLIAGLGGGSRRRRDA
jgi:signal peptidase I